MSLSQRFSGRKGKNGECEAIIQGGGFQQLTGLGAGSTTLLNTAPYSTASHLLVTNTTGSAVIQLSSAGVERGALKKIGFTVGGAGISLASLAGTSQIVNGTSLVANIAATTGAAVVLQYIGNNTWKLVEINGNVTLS